MQDWSSFYATIGAAAAALLGLLFVSVSVNPSAALGPEEAVSRRLTEQAFQNYLAVMMTALLALYPGISTRTYGGVLLLATASWSVWVFVRFGQTVVQRAEWRTWVASLRRHLSSLIGFTIMLVVGLRMLMNWGQDFNWLASATLALLFSATTVSWELLTRIARRKAA